MQKWEYRSINMLSYCIQDLNMFGLDGWELVGFCGKVAYFKRPIIDTQESEKGDDYIVQIVDDLLESGINFSIERTSLNSLCVSIVDNILYKDVSAHVPDIVTALEVLKNKVCEWYPNSLFASKYKDR